MTDVSVFDLLIDAVAECGREARRKNIHLIPTIGDPGPEIDDLELRGDPDLLRTMVVNLLRNAISFSPSGENIDVRAALDGDFAEISVRDRGPGVPEEMLELIFDRFFQAPSTGPRRSGSGLGLAIARSVASLHGGAVRVENCPDRGAAFTVRLPLAGREPEKPADAEPPTTDPCTDPEPPDTPT
ncbi:MAG: HAMP domain-containing histidine kinase [Phycisphaerales bacterium]|nr:HAMP domain-containing histidine kinase [Phycisphaerales bacterium]